jgi:hypothetical protein
MVSILRSSIAPVEIPVLVTGRRLAVSDELRGYASRRLSFALGRFANEIRSADLLLEDVSGRAPVTKRCRIELRLRRGGQVSVFAEAANDRAAMARAAQRAATILDRARKRRWMARRRRLAREGAPA